MFTLKLEILPTPQRELWKELEQTPKKFVLYGGTSLALRLGHRSSEDFDFFSNETFAPGILQKSVPYLKGAEVIQSEQYSHCPCGSERACEGLILRRT